MNIQIVIGEEIVDEKSNEIAAIPILLDEINVKDATVTIDAIFLPFGVARLLALRQQSCVIILDGQKTSSPPRKCFNLEILRLLPRHLNVARFLARIFVAVQDEFLPE